MATETHPRATATPPSARARPLRWFRTGMRDSLGAERLLIVAGTDVDDARAALRAAGITADFREPEPVGVPRGSEPATSDRHAPLFW